MKVEKVDKEQIFKGSELQYKDTDGLWYDCNGIEYRIKPKTKTVRFRNYLTTLGYVSITSQEHATLNFKEWIGDWQSIEVEQ